MQASCTTERQFQYTHVYLSPHLDDAVLSCGGRIWQQVQAGARVRVVTVFAGVPASGTPLSPFAQELHARWEHPTDAVANRREEDRSALGRLGAETIHWPYADCIYRQAPDGHFPYASVAALWGEIHPAEERLVTELATQVTALPLSEDSTVYAPLGVRHHVDHQITRRAAEAAGLALTYYEDYPYAEDPHRVRLALAEQPARAELILLSEGALEAKTSAIARYRSQISTFWADATDMAAAIRAFAERTGNGLLAERYWQLGAKTDV
jgi:LmbE family N-acetylglucosaminyl deacetylase